MNDVCQHNVLAFTTGAVNSHTVMEKKEMEYPVRVVKGLSAVTIYKIINRGKFDLYTLAWRVGRERQRRSFADPHEAQAEAERIATALSNGSARMTEVTGQELEYYRSCELALKPVPLHVAVDFYLRSQGGTQKGKPLADVVKEYIARAVDASRSSRHVETLRHHLNLLATAFPGNINAVTVQKLEVYLRAHSWHSRTRNNHLVSIVSLFRYARERGYLPDAKTEAEKATRGQLRREDPVVFTVEETEKLINGARVEIVPYLALAAFAGIRSAEIVRLKWEDINFETRHIAMSSRITKTGRRRMINMMPNLIDWLEPFRGQKGPVVPLSEVHRHLRKLQLDTGVVWKKNALRHGHVTYLMALTGNSAQVSQETGHSVDEMETSYKGLVTKAEAERYYAIRPRPTPRVLKKTA